MKYLVAFCLVATVAILGPSFVELSATPPTSSVPPTEKPVIKSETVVESGPDSAPSTQAPGLKSRDPALPVRPFKPNELHRIPLFKDEPRNPPVETVDELLSAVEEVKSTVAPGSATSISAEGVEQESNKTAATTTTSSEAEFHLPIPARCPQITGTAEPPNATKQDSMLAMLESASLPKAAQRGCRFFIMHELMQRSKAHSDEFAHMDEAASLNKTLHDCFKTCIDAYDNGSDLAKACTNGCIKTAQATEVAKSVLLSTTSDDELEREDESHGQPEIHRSFSIIIPIRPMESGDQDSDVKNSGFPIMVPNAIKMMLSMMHQMTERARAAMMMQQQQQQSQSEEGTQTEVDGQGNSISVSRSMSVLVTKDQDGHSKMVVVHTLPKVQIHRFPGSLFDDDESPFGEESKDSSHSHSDEDDSASDNDFDTDNLRIKLFGHLSRNLGENGHGVQQKQHETKHKETQVYYYRSRLCYYLPRLFYITLVILVLYVIFWLFCAVPSALYGRNRRGSIENGGGVAIIATNGDGKRKKFFFTKNQKYFQLNNKRLSTTSLPPPYPGMTDNDNGSCAEPLPEKLPLPADDDETTQVKN